MRLQRVFRVEQWHGEAEPHPFVDSESRIGRGGQKVEVQEHLLEDVARFLGARFALVAYIVFSARIGPPISIVANRRRLRLE